MSLLTTQGDKADFLSRLKGLMPKGWFGGGDTPINDAVLSAAADNFASLYSMLVYVKQQTRIGTATGPFLDLVANDFFQGRLPRQANESDTNYRARIFARLFRNGPTRQDLEAIITQIAGTPPQIVEPSRPQDCGGWDMAQMGWDNAGHWGDDLPYQAFVTVQRPKGTGIPYVGGWDSPVGAWDTASQAEWTDASQMGDVVTDAAIYAAVAANKPEGTVVWTRIVGQFPTVPVPVVLGVNTFLPFSV